MNPTQRLHDLQRVLAFLHETGHPVRLRDVVGNDEICDILGINRWCVNEGADGDEEVDVIGMLQTWEMNDFHC